MSGTILFHGDVGRNLTNEPPRARAIRLLLALLALIVWLGGLPRQINTTSCKLSCSNSSSRLGVPSLRVFTVHW
jgi:hypothetical protein